MRKKRIFSAIILMIFTFSNYAFAYQNNSYYRDIKVALTRVSSTSISVTLEGDYKINNQLFTNGTSLNLVYNGGKINLNGNQYSEITFVPQSTNNKLKISGNGSTYRYLGTVNFKAVSGKILPINNLNIEDYLKGVVGHEMPSSFPLEALKAQAVAARNYALAIMQQNDNNTASELYDVDDTISYQVYYGYEANTNVINAVEQTRGVVLTYNGNLISAYFSASNGGYTEKSGNVWLTDLPYFDSKPDDFDGPGSYSGYNQYYHSSLEFSVSDIDSILKNKGYIEQSNLKFSGNWTDASEAVYSKGSTKYSKSAGSYVEFVFQGTGIRWIGHSDNHKGIAKVTIDDTISENVDTYSSTVQYQKVLYEKSGLNDGTHKIRIEVTGTKNEISLDSYIDVDAFEIIGGSKAGRYEESNSSFIEIDLGSITKYPSGRISNITIRYRDVHGNIVTRSFSKESARTFLSLKSAKYNVTYSNGKYRFEVDGYGHGIGMSQIGAKNRADAGQKYDVILKFYYPGTKLETIPPSSATITNIYANSSNIYAGLTPVTINVESSIGDSSQIIYLFEAYKDGKVAASKSYSSDSSFTFTPQESGSYIVRAYAKNKNSSNDYDDAKEIVISVQPEPAAWTGNNGISVQRLSGSDRYETAISISKNGWPNGSSYAVIATGEDFPDALAAAPLAKSLNAPILLTYKTTLDGRVANEIKRLGAKNVYIVGSEGAVYRRVEYQLKDIGVKNVIRLAGRDRYETSVRIAQELVKITGKLSEVAVVTGRDFPDAISIAPFAANKGMPILLTYDISLPASVKSFLGGKSISKTYVIGSNGVISDGVKQQLKNAERLAGSDRYQTNYSVVNRFMSSIPSSTIFVVTGKNYPDAITASSYAARSASPIILSDSIIVRDTRYSIGSRISSIKNIILIGSNKVVPVTTLDGIAR